MTKPLRHLKMQLKNSAVFTWSPPFAVDGVEFVEREGALHIAVIAKGEHPACLFQHLETQRVRKVCVPLRQRVTGASKRLVKWIV